MVISTLLVVYYPVIPCDSALPAGPYSSLDGTRTLPALLPCCKVRLRDDTLYRRGLSHPNGVTACS